MYLHILLLKDIIIFSNLRLLWIMLQQIFAYLSFGRDSGVWLLGGGQAFACSVGKAKAKARWFPSSCRWACYCQYVSSFFWGVSPTWTWHPCLPRWIIRLNTFSSVYQPSRYALSLRAFSSLVFFFPIWLSVLFCGALQVWIQGLWQFYVI